MSFAVREALNLDSVQPPVAFFNHEIVLKRRYALDGHACALGKDLLPVRGRRIRNGSFYNSKRFCGVVCSNKKGFSAMGKVVFDFVNPRQDDREWLARSAGIHVPNLRGQRTVDLN